MDQTRPNGRSWLFFAAGAVVLIMTAGVRWSMDHPYGTSWDEAEYINQTMVDAQRLAHGMILKLGGRILIKSWGRPPAYRILALPFVAVFGARTAVMRLGSLLCFPFSVMFTWMAARRIAGPTAGAFAALVFCLSPEVVAASLWYSTEGPLYLATAAMLYFLFRSWCEPAEQPATWIGLGLAIGVGFLSKASFVMLALPLLAFWLVADRNRCFVRGQFGTQWKAGLIAALVAGPWWILNLKLVMLTTQSAREFTRQSLGVFSFSTLLRWGSSVLQGMIGHGVSIFTGLVLAVLLLRTMRGGNRAFDSSQKLAFAACGLVGLPLMLIQLTGTNHLLRHISPVVIPLAISVGMVCQQIEWGRSVPTAALTVLLLGVQLAMLVYPAFIPNTQPVDPGLVNGRLPWRVTFRRDQWDWQPLYDIAAGCAIERPAIAYLGAAPSTDPPSIQYPWAARGTDLPDVTWLWREEDGPLDWTKVLEAAGHSDVLFTVVAFPTQALDANSTDNSHNAEFAERLAQDPRFHGPVHQSMGRFAPFTIAIFEKASISCVAAPETQGKR